VEMSREHGSKPFNRSMESNVQTWVESEAVDQWEMAMLFDR